MAGSTTGPAGDAGPTPPGPVRRSFALFTGAALVALVNAVLQVVLGYNGPIVLVGAVAEALVFVLLGSFMRVGRLWARVSLMSVAWIFIAVSLLSLFGLNGAFGRHMDGLVMLTMAYVVLELLLIGFGTVLMYRPGMGGYFR